MNPEFAIEVKNLTKVFRISSGWFSRKIIVALENVSFNVPTGRAFGILGANGSGKSTLLKILSTLLVPSSGNAWVGGFSLSKIQHVKPLIGLISGEAKGFSGRLNAWQNLEFYAALQHLPLKNARQRIGELFERVGLANQDGQPVWTFSTGQSQRLNIARALLHDPPILLFDEPTKGLDFWTAKLFRNWLRMQLIEKEGKTLLMATHQPEDLRELCEEAIMLREGRLVWQGLSSKGIPDL